MRYYIYRHDCSTDIRSTLPTMLVAEIEADSPELACMLAKQQLDVSDRQCLEACLAFRPTAEAEEEEREFELMERIH